MKFPTLSLLAFLLPSIVNACDLLLDSAFHLEFDGHCDYENLLETFTTFYEDPIESYSCTESAEEALQILLGNTTIQEICRSAYESYDFFAFSDIAKMGGDFEQIYYNGGTDWNEEFETKYPTDADGNPTNHLRKDAARVKQIYDTEAEYGLIEWPDSLTNFNPKQCQYNSAYCCWPKDRQANDNNGNCNSPYDERCHDKDPSDNTNLCYVDLERGQMSSGHPSKNGYELFPFDDPNDNNNPTDRGEGQIHCHGLAWSEEDSDASAAYKGNNLFFISMYDHMHERGYVENIPGAPMCACTEQMPIVERADCTQIRAEEAFKITYNGDDGFSAELTEIDIEFQSCQGFDRRGRADNNDLWSYMNRLYHEGKVSANKLAYLSQMLVGEDPDNCDIATDRFMKEKGYVTGYEHSSLWEPVASKGNFDILYVGDFAFNALMNESPNKIVRRVCADCYEAHQDIYYKRMDAELTLEKLDQLDILHNIANERSSKAGHEWNKDFQIFSTYSDAVKGENPWVCPYNYRYDRGFPGYCGPEGYDKRSFINQETKFVWPEGKRDVKFYVERNTQRTGPQTELTRVASTDVGAVAFPGATFETTKDDGSLRLFMTASGKDIWGLDDEFHFMHSTTTGDVEMVANIVDLKHKSPWTKAGLMVRDTLDAGSKYCGVFRTGANGVNVQFRSETGGHSYHKTLFNDKVTPMTKPWLKLVKSGTICTGFMSATGEDDDWERLGDPVHIEIGDPTEYVGLALSATNDGHVAEVTVDDYEESFYECKEVNNNRSMRRRTMLA